MLPNASKNLDWLENNPNSLIGIQRGLERETLRVNSNGRIAKTNHPKSLGSALTHKWITTDFAESLLEFITPVDSDIDYTFSFMRDIHRYVARNLKNEYMWPFSMPCYIACEKEIKLAQYGTSNIGNLKTLYREGLRNRYGALMQIISGVHYNFSFPMIFWKLKYGEIDKDIISEDYFRLIRNYHRFGWIISYLFGSSPAVCSSFLQGKSTKLQFKKTNFETNYLTYSTSLRLSDLGYTNKSQKNFFVSFNSLHEYLEEINRAINTPSKRYQKIGLKKHGKRLQINSNILQIENEFYAPIRPKRTVKKNETLSDALRRGGIEYIEIRSLDINSFSPIGVDKKQVRFLDLFMIWCVLADAKEITFDERICIQKNWSRVVLEGRKPGLMLSVNSENKQYPLSKIGKYLFFDLKRVAKILDNIYGNEEYQKVCDELVIYFDNPDLTFSARILRFMMDYGINNTGNILATEYLNILKREPLQVLREKDFFEECEESIIRQHKIEAMDSEEFEIFLEKLR